MTLLLFLVIVDKANVTPYKLVGISCHGIYDICK